MHNRGNINVHIERGIELTDEQRRLLVSYMQYCSRALMLKNEYDCYLVKNREKYGVQTTAVCYLQLKKIYIYCKDRLFADVLRSIAHESYHLRQVENNQFPDMKYLHFSSEIEDSANEVAGKLLNAFTEVMGYETIYGEKFKVE